MKEKEYTIINYPRAGQLYGSYYSASPNSAAKKAFSQLSRKIDLKNTNRKNVLVFTIGEVLKGDRIGKTYKYMGMRVELEQPVEVNIKNKKVVYRFKNIVSAYDSSLGI